MKIKSIVERLFCMNYVHIINEQRICTIKQYSESSFVISYGMGY